jgi:RHS repeat-associated protein
LSLFGGLGEDDHRFGFNGKENDKEWGNQIIQDYGFRLYNPALGKFLSFDPLASEYPWNAPYSFAENSPIKFIDLDGLEKESHGSDVEMDMTLELSLMLNLGIEGTLNLGIDIAESIYPASGQANAVRNAWARQSKTGSTLNHLSDEDVIANFKLRYVTGEGYQAQVRGSFLGEQMDRVNNVLNVLPFSPGKNEVATFGKSLIAKNLAKKFVQKNFRFNEELASGIGADHILGNADLTNSDFSNTAYFYVHAIMKDPNSPVDGSVFENMTSVFEEIAKQNGLKEVQIEFGLVKNNRLASDSNWAVQFGYNYEKIQKDEITIDVLWTKFLEE